MVGGQFHEAFAEAKLAGCQLLSGDDGPSGTRMGGSWLSVISNWPNNRPRWIAASAPQDSARSRCCEVMVMTTHGKPRGMLLGPPQQRLDLFFRQVGVYYQQIGLQLGQQCCRRQGAGDDAHQGNVCLLYTSPASAGSG